MQDVKSVREDFMSLLTNLKNTEIYSLFENLLRSGLVLRVKVTGKSMSPFLENGSYVTLSKIPVSGLRIGDIIFCQCNDGSFKLHRLLQIDNDMLITKGDALGSFDVPFKKTDYKGKVVCIEQHSAKGLMHRNLENQSSRINNYLIARFHLLRVYLNCIYVRLKSKPARS